MFLDSSDEVQDLSGGWLLYFKQFHECGLCVDFRMKNITANPNWSSQYVRTFK